MAKLVQKQGCHGKKCQVECGLVLRFGVLHTRMVHCGPHEAWVRLAAQAKSEMSTASASDLAAARRSRYALSNSPRSLSTCITASMVRPDKTDNTTAGE